MRKYRLLLPFFLLGMIGIFVYFHFFPSPKKVTQKEKTAFRLGTWEYIYPVSPVRKLAANFGEPRPAHFHAGIDVKTDQKTGIPLRAVRDGYIYRIRIATDGYGKTLYLRHYDGTFSVYAHLEKFEQELDNYIYLNQLVKRKYEQDLYFRRDEKKVRRGDLLAFSGNSGHSYAPHLHFEVRDKENRPINPLPFFQSFLNDNLPPSIQVLAFEPINENSRIFGKLEKYKTNLTQKGNNYEIAEIIQVSGKVGVEFSAFDKMNGSENKCGVYRTRLELDSKVIFEQKMKQLRFSETEQVNLHTDYVHYLKTGEWLEKCYKEKGVTLPNYVHLQKEGIIELSDEKVHEFCLILSDLYDNQTVIKGKIQQKKNENEPISFPKTKGNPKMELEIKRNRLMVSVQNPTQNEISWRGMKGEWQKNAPIYYHAQSKTAVYALPFSEKLFPTEIQLSPEITPQSTFIQKCIIPEAVQTFSEGELEIRFPAQAVFDTIPLFYRKEKNEFWVGNPLLPLSKPFQLTFTLTKAQDSLHTVVARKMGDKWIPLATTHKKGGKISAKSSIFGVFSLMQDSIPPTIKTVNFFDNQLVAQNQKDFTFLFQDNFSQIVPESILAFWDERWVVLEYDEKTGIGTFSIRKRREGEHSLSVQAKDYAGNWVQKTYCVKM